MATSEWRRLGSITQEVIRATGLSQSFGQNRLLRVRKCMPFMQINYACLLYTSDAADDSLRVDLGGRRII